MKIRKKLYLLIKIPISILIIIFAIFRIQYSDTAPKLAIEIFVEAIVIFGIFVKTILAIIFPEIVLDKEGIKFIGRKKIKWSQAKCIRILEEDHLIQIFIEKHNMKKITESIKNLDITSSKLEKEFINFSPNVNIVRNETNF